MKNHSPSDVQTILEDVQAAHLEWKKISIQERCRSIARVGEVLLAQKQELALICTEEMGKLLKESIAEVEKCALACEYYAQHAESFLAREDIKTEGVESYVTYQPLGVILAVMPWNFPYWQVIRFAAPALCAGNGALLKHASNVPRSSLALEKVFQDAGLPANIFRSLLIGPEQVASVIEHPVVKAVTLTGSTAAGKKVAAKAGECLKKTVLELGGSDAYIILEDADLDLAARVLVQGRMLNAGQSCISPKRFIAVKEIYSTFKDKVYAQMKDLVCGESIGPMAKKDLREELHVQVRRSIDAGAELLLGGKIPEGDLAYYPPTLLAQVRPGMAAFDEELFGPVVCLIEAADETEAIRLANESVYGLGGGIFTRDHRRARKIAEEHFEAGGVFINDFLKSDPRLPFGGIKESGYGRELSRHGIREFVNAKTIFFKS